VADRSSGGRKPTRELLLQFSESDYENSSRVPILCSSQRHNTVLETQVHPGVAGDVTGHFDRTTDLDAIDEDLSFPQQREESDLSRANMAHIRQSRPDYGLGFQLKS